MRSNQPEELSRAGEPAVGEEAAAHLPPALKGLILLARQNRQKSTTAESLLWHILRNRQVLGHKFRRQHPFGRFIADFYCDDVRLIVEIDGSIHDCEAQKIRDHERDAISRQYGLQTLRFTNQQVLDDTIAVISSIVTHILAHPREPASIPIKGG